VRALLLGSILALAATTAAGGDFTPRSLALGKHGQLEIQAPVTWNDSVAPAKDGLPQSLKLTPKTGKTFEVYVTPFPPEDSTGRPATMDELRRAAREAANSIAYRAVEKPIELKEIRGAGTQGYYFAVTDKAPKAEEFKFMSQGVLSVGQLKMMFTIFTNDGQQAVVKEALTVVTGAAHR
jgi:hypothetical protein